MGLYFDVIITIGIIVGFNYMNRFKSKLKYDLVQIKL